MYICHTCHPMYSFTPYIPHAVDWQIFIYAIADTIARLAGPAHLYWLRISIKLLLWLQIRIQISYIFQAIITLTDILLLCFVFQYIFGASSEVQMVFINIFSIFDIKVPKRLKQNDHRKHCPRLLKMCDLSIWITAVHEYWVKFDMGWFSDDFISLNPNLLYDILNVQYFGVKMPTNKMAAGRTVFGSQIGIIWISEPMQRINTE